MFFVPGEHDVSNDDGKQYPRALRKNAKGAGWYSFDMKGVHFIGLVNVMNLKAGGLGDAWRGTTGMAGKRRQASLEKHSDHGVCAHPTVGGVSRVGLGNG